jgi:hypothetical protein
MEIPLPTIPPSFPAPQKKKRFSAIMIIGLLIVGLVAGALAGYTVTYSAFNSKLSNIEN